MDQQEESGFKRHIWINMDDSAPNEKVVFVQRSAD